MTLQDSRLEPDLETLLWGQVNLFHRTVDRIERELDDNEQAQKRSQREQDGSEVKSVELERLLAEGMTLIERRNAFELMRRFRFAVVAIITVADIQSVYTEPSVTPSAASCRAHAPEAATRSGVAVDVILRVMQAESGDSPSVISIKGAIGCMQIMPATWTYLSQRYNLGGGPYDARMNMIGGALYLAELARRFGWPGAYAAYNAGPARYIRYASNGVPLPAETVAYAARLGGAAAPAIAAIPLARWQEARLFLDRSAGDRGAIDNHALKLVTAPGEAGVAPASVDAPPTRGMVATLFPLSSNAAQIQR